MSDCDSDISSLSVVDEDFSQRISALETIDQSTSDLRIQDLPELTNDFDATTDYLIIQRVNQDGDESGVYKMLLSNLTALTQVSQYVDAAGLYVSSAPASGSRFIFSAAGLFNTNSSFILTTSFNHATTSFIKQPGSLNINGVDNLVPSTNTTQEILDNDIMTLYADITYDSVQNRIMFENIFYVAKGSGDTLISNNQTLTQSQFYASIQANISSS
ncbi:MAG: hypothetical protein CL833_01010 [Crocinitomicaceae bacterium]|nr:hypothetical protein [Crocinitomicaceae bacterium]